MALTDTLCRVFYQSHIGALVFLRPCIESYFYEFESLLHFLRQAHSEIDRTKLQQSIGSVISKEV